MVVQIRCPSAKPSTYVRKETTGMLRTTSSDSSQCKSLFQQQAGGDDDDDDDDDIYIRVCACVYTNMKFLCTHAFTFVDTGTPPAMHTRAKEDQMPHSSLVVTTIITRETAAGEREREREIPPIIMCQTWFPLFALFLYLFSVASIFFLSRVANSSTFSPLM